MLTSAGCVSVPTEQKLLNNATLDTEKVAEASCDKDKIIRYSNGSASQQDKELDPSRISVLNWNVYKGQRDNWESDFQRYSYMHSTERSHLNGRHPRNKCRVGFVK